jgi:divalent metal cation (Fe/Co/Zn/Cd) transporter
MADALAGEARRRDLVAALRLEYLTVGWNVVEGLVAVAAALSAGSVVLLGFGIDSFVESASAGVLIWRLRAERQGRTRSIEGLDRRARHLVGISLLLLATYVAVDAIRALAAREHAGASLVGVALTLVSIAVMVWLARAKRAAAARIGSRALAADAVQTSACFWLSIAALAGLALNALWGLWWADPAAALVLAALIAHEGREAWRGEDCAAC